MKIFIICSKAFYDKIAEIKTKLEEKNHIIILPNSYDNPNLEFEIMEKGEKIHKEWKKKMFNLSIEKIKDVDAVLVLNFQKNGIDNYIGGATFLEMYDAFRYKKKIFMYNDIPKGMLYDEILGFEPILINGDLNLVK